MSDFLPVNEFDQLVNGLLNQILTVEEHQRLSELLNAHPELQDRYFSQVDLHLALQRAYTETPEREPFRGAFWQQPVADHAKRSVRQSRWTIQTAALVALGVSVVAFVLWPEVKQDDLAQQPVPAVHPVSGSLQPSAGDKSGDVPVVEEISGARLVQSAGAEFLREMVPQLDSLLEVNHQYVLVKGMLELEFHRGARAILEAPAVFQVNSSEQLQLQVGNCSVYAPEGAQGFEVLTPRNRVVDLGTRFSISVNDFGHSELQVVEGVAQVSPRSNQQVVKTLTRGQASRCIGSDDESQKIEFNPKSYQYHLPDRVVSYEARVHGQGPGVRDLTSVTVQRGGQVYTYPVEELIGIDLLHFRTQTNRNSVASDQETLKNVEELITRDRALNTGIINFDQEPGAKDTDGIPADYRKKPGMAIQFHQPVRNDPGPDVVLFEIQSVVYPAEGDHFRVSPLHRGPGLHPHLVTRYDITLNSRNAREVAPFRVFTFDSEMKSIKDLAKASARRGGGMSLPFYALAVGIDLSDLGYPAGAEVSGLFFEDANHKSFVVIDPVFIGGFPSLNAVPPTAKQ